MKYINLNLTADKRTPIDQSRIRIPNISLGGLETPEFFAPYGYVPYVANPSQHNPATHTAVRTGYDDNGSETWQVNEIVVSVPQEVSPKQLRLALLANNISFTDIETAINTLDESVRAAALISWEYAISFERSSALVEAVGALLEKDSAWIDALFTQASSL
jgi:hypothetical protein